MIPELSALRDRRPHVSRLEVPERADVPPVLRILVAQKPRAPSGVVPLPPLAFRDRGDVDDRSFPTKFRDGDVRPEQLLRVFDAVLDGRAPDPTLHHIWLLVRPPRQPRRPRLGAEAHGV